MKTNKFLLLNSSPKFSCSIEYSKYLSELRVEALKTKLLGRPLKDGDSSAIIVNVCHELETKTEERTGLFGRKTTREVVTKIKFYVFTTGEMTEENKAILYSLAWGIYVGLSIKE
jgi:hypothetical protein